MIATIWSMLNAPKINSSRKVVAMEDHLFAHHNSGVARVSPLACANEHLLRTMDSLVAVQ